MSMLTALNPLLYQALQYAAQSGRFGHSCRTVRVTRAGQRNIKSKQYDIRTGRHYWKIENEGEVYQVCCPFCQDRRYRLNINHEWGVPDPELNTRNYFMVNCFNEQCHKRDSFLEQFKYRIQMDAGVSFHLDASVPVVQTRLHEFRSPGMCQPLHELAAADPNHRAVTLIRNRGYDPVKLGYYWGVSYCYHGVFPFSHDRIIFPVFKDGKQVGWQARYVGPDGRGKVDGLHFCRTCGFIQTPDGSRLHRCTTCGNEDIRPVTKYWTMPGMSTSENAMNWDIAATWPFVVATEGPLDPIRLGRPDAADVPGPGICCFGHTLSPYHRRLILETRKILVLLYDQDVWEKTLLMANELRGFVTHVLPVPLPDKTDPGDLPHHFLWDTIRYHAYVSGVPLGI